MMSNRLRSFSISWRIKEEKSFGLGLILMHCNGVRAEWVEEEPKDSCHWGCEENKPGCDPGHILIHRLTPPQYSWSSEGIKSKPAVSKMAASKPKKPKLQPRINPSCHCSRHVRKCKNALLLLLVRINRESKYSISKLQVISLFYS